MALAIILATLSGFRVAEARADDLPDIPYIAIERESGAILTAHRALDRWYPASLTKLMTLYVTLEAVRAGELQPGSPVKISAEAARQPPSKMGYAPGTQLRVDTAMKILVVKSANDVAVALAEAVAGSTGAFVARMNDTARRLGMRDSAFANPNGLHDTGQYVTARDMAVLARRLLLDFSRYASLFAIPAIQSGETIHYSYNLLLERFDGADGMKTGFVCASGYNMVASASRNSRQIIAIVLGAFSQTERAVSAARVLLDGFNGDGGPSVTDYRPASSPAPPTSQRSRMCSEQARQGRYDPGAGDARIESPYLSQRRITRSPVPVSTGGIDAPPSEAMRYAAYIPRGAVPVPAPRPQFVRLDIDGIEVSGNSPSPGAIPLPTPRPDRATMN